MVDDELGRSQLRSVRLFGRCDDQTLDRILPVSPERRYAAGDTIVRAGQPAREVPVLLDGYAGAEVEGFPALVLGPGAALGAAESIEGGSFPLTVVAQTPVVARLVPASILLQLVTTSPSSALDLIRQLGGQTRTVLDELACARQGSVTPQPRSSWEPAARWSSSVAPRPQG